MAKQQARTEQTKRRIQAALWQHYKDLPIEKISVRLIADTARINRSTFYVYYPDAFAVLDDIVQSVLTDITSQLNHILSIQPSMEKTLQLSARLLTSKREYFDVMIFRRQNYHFAIALHQTLRDALRPIIMQHIDDSSACEDYLIYMTSGIIMLAMQLLMREANLSDDQYIRRVIRAVCTQFPLHPLAQNTVSSDYDG